MSTEIQLRRLRGEPPFRDVLVLTASGPDEAGGAPGVHPAAPVSGERAAQTARAAFSLLGPAPAAVAKVNNRYRYRLTLADRTDRPLRALIAALLRAAQQDRENRGILYLPTWTPWTDYAKERSIMALREISTRGTLSSTRSATRSPRFDTSCADLLDDMRETLAQANGLGLAAPQVGILRRAVLVVNDQDEMLELINPEIIASEGEQDGLEGCLSVPGKWGYVKRPQWVKVRRPRTGTETGSRLRGQA